MDRLVCRRLVALGLALVLTSPEWAFAQPGGGGFYPGGGGRGGRGRRFPRGMDQMNTAPPTTNPAAEEKPKEEKKDDKPAEPKKDEGPKPITRPPAFDNSASLAEQQMTIDSKRQVSFNFQEAPWTFVVEELARVSGATLDWTQLPGDSFNLRSNKKYSVAEARDMISEHLLARGYAILFDSKTNQMKIVQLDDLNTALVPRVAPEDLDSLPPHDLVKVSFHLDWLLAKEAVDEFKQVLSPKAKLLPLKTSNRLEAIDAVVNLKQLASLLDEEQGRGGLNRLAQEFELRYTRAPEVVDQLELFLGLKKPGENGAGNANPFQQMMMQRMQMMQQQQGGQQPGQQPPGMQAPPEIHLMANRRRNTVIVNAPPDKMGIIKSAIWKIDVPSDRPTLADNTQLMQPYRLTTVDPEVVVNFLETVGDLDPQTKLDIDKKTHTVIAYATPKDQKVIGALVKNLDNSERNLKVIPLRKLDADLVAGTIRMLMVGDDKNKTDNNSGGGRRYGGWFSAMAASSNNEEQSTSKFRVEADIVENRLLVFADATELEKVYKCLAEMGEVPKRERGVEMMRVLDVGAGNDEKVLLERLKQVWPSRGKDGNKLIIDVPERKTTPPAEDSKPNQTAPKAPAAATPSTVPSASSKPDKTPKPTATKAERSASLLPAARIEFVGLNQVVAPDDRMLADATNGNAKSSSAVSAPASSEAPAAPANSRPARKVLKNGLQEVQIQPSDDAPSAGKSEQQPDAKPTQGAPIYITRGEDGKLIFTSRDTAALDRIEEMAGHLAPKRKDYAVYYLKHADAYSVKLNLDDFFQTEKKETGEDRARRWWWDDDSSNKKDDSPMLSRRKPMRFIVDGQTNSILVQGGTSEQLRQIKELIDMYDSPAPVSVRPARLTQMFHIQHSKASIIADVIKDMYRDLLSTKDKAMESFNQTKNQGKGGRGYISYDFGEKEDDGKMSQARFSGAVSMGVDDTTNTLLVSCANQTLMINISEIIERLDKAAVQAAQSFQVLQINRSIDANALQKKLAEMLKKTGPVPEAGQQPNQGQQKQNQRRGRGGRNGGGNGGGDNEGNETSND
jgi:type II secretory pathway component GspD/PulD (secretin)